MNCPVRALFRQRLSCAVFSEAPSNPPGWRAQPPSCQHRPRAAMRETFHGPRGFCKLSLSSWVFHFSSGKPALDVTHFFVKNVKVTAWKLQK